MPLLALIFTGWLIVMFLRGWFRGFWSMLAGLLALIAAYALAIALTPTMAPRFESIGVPPAFSMAVAATAVWMLSTLVLTFAFKLLTAPLARREGWLGNLGGGLVGVAFGAVTGLFAIWGYSFVKTVLDENTAYVGETSPLEGVAASFVSRITEAGMSVAGASDAMRDLATARQVNEQRPRAGRDAGLTEADDRPRSATTHAHRQQRGLAADRSLQNINGNTGG